MNQSSLILSNAECDFNYNQGWREAASMYGYVTSHVERQATALTATTTVYVSECRYVFKSGSVDGHRQERLRLRSQQRILVVSLVSVMDYYRNINNVGFSFYIST